MVKQFKVSTFLMTLVLLNGFSSSAASANMFYNIFNLFHGHAQVAVDLSSDSNYHHEGESALITANIKLECKDRFKVGHKVCDLCHYKRNLTVFGFMNGALVLRKNISLKSKEVQSIQYQSQALSKESRNIFYVKVYEKMFQVESEHLKLNVGDAEEEPVPTPTSTPEAIPTPVPTPTSAVDTLAPVITFGINNPVFTTRDQLSLPITILDENEVMVSIKLNGVEIMQTSHSFINSTIILQNGVNEVVVDAVDEAGNTSSSTFGPITFDPSPFAITILSPSISSPETSLTFVITGNANRPLKEVRVNGQLLNIDEDGRSFQGNYTVANYGSVFLTVMATDLEDNVVSTPMLISVVRP